jgi:outer membrane receptor protein involved in Fe transport
VTADRSYSTPSSLTEETEAAGYAHLSIQGQLDVATANSVSADVSHTTAASTVTFTLFHSHVDHPTLVDRATYTLHTDADPLTARGIELLAATRRGPFAVTGTYAFIEAQERGGQDVPLTPRHRARVFAAAEGERRGRIGVGIDFTGVQRLEANPYRSSSEPYTTVSLLGEYPIGHWRLFAAAQNLTDVKQTNWDPIARPAPDVDGRWTVDAWAPLAGRVINFGFRASF